MSVEVYIVCDGCKNPMWVRDNVSHRIRAILKKRGWAVACRSRTKPHGQGRLDFCRACQNKEED